VLSAQIGKQPVLSSSGQNMVHINDLAGSVSRFQVPSAIVAVPSIVALYWAITTFFQWRRLKHVPGPTWAPFSKWWMFSHTMKGDLHLATKEACEKYGKLRLVSIPSVPLPHAFRRTNRRLVFRQQPHQWLPPPWIPFGQGGKGGPKKI